MTRRRPGNPGALAGGRALLPREVLAEDFSLLQVKRRTRRAPRKASVPTPEIRH